MGTVILVTDQVFGDFSADIAKAGDAGFELILADGNREKMLNIPEPERVSAIYNTYYGPVDGELMDAYPNLCGIVRCGIGVDTIDLKAAKQRGLKVANVPDYCIEEVASHAFAMFVALARRLRLADKLVREGKWSVLALKPVKALSDYTVGVVGFGRIGRKFAEMVKPLVGKVVYYDPYVESDSLERVKLNELYATADAISLHLPLREDTKGMLDKTGFDKMSNKPIIINVSRGGLIVTDDLSEALASGQIFGAGLDIVDGLGDGVRDHRLFDFDNVILSPHSAWYSERAMVNLRENVLSEAMRLARGEEAKNEVRN